MHNLQLDVGHSVIPGRTTSLRWSEPHFKDSNSSSRLIILGVSNGMHEIEEKEWSNIVETTYSSAAFLQLAT